MAAWPHTPTEDAPEGWLSAFEAAVDAYHEAATEPIPANEQYNALVEYLTETYIDEETTCTNPDPSANCAGHDHYVPECPDCRVIESCTECGDDQQPIVRIELESCGDDCTDVQTPHDYRLQNEFPSPPDVCEDCLERRYCAECAADAGLAPIETDGDDSVHDGPAASQPLTLALGLTCHQCGSEGFEATATDDSESEDCYCETRTTTAPFQRLPTTAEEYFTGPEWDSDSLTAEDYLNAGHDPNALRHSEAHTDGRNWSDDAFEDNRLGWAPATPAFKKPIVERLLAAGHTPTQLYATGLFEPDWRHTADALTGEWGSLDATAIITGYDIAACLNDSDHELTGVQMVKPKWNGRLVFPYFVATDRLEELADLFGIELPEADLEAYTGSEAPEKVPVYACSRSQSTVEHPSDSHSGAKYAKMRDYDYTYATEPIWGTETLEQQETIVVTEGIADAIAAADDGLCVLSPVTVRFKTKHERLLTGLCDLYNVNHVRLAQDNEPASIARLAPEDVRDEDRQEAQETLAKYERMLDSESQDLQKVVTERDTIRGPLSHFLETDGVSAGLAGAFSTEKRLLDEGYTPIHIDLPRLSTAKVDLDDYLSSGLADYIPLFPGLGVIDADNDEATEADVMELIEESGRVGRLYEAGYCHWRQATTAATLESDEPDTGVPAFDWRPVAPAPDEFTLDTTSPDATECLRRGLAIANDSELVVDRTNSPPVVRHRETAMTEGDGTPRKWREFDAPTLDRARVDDMDTEALIEAATKDAAGNFSLGMIAGRLGTAGSREDGLARPVAGVEEYVGESRYTIDEGDERQEITPLFDAPRVCDPREHPMWSAFKRSSSGRAAYGGGGGDGSTGSPKGASGRQSALYELSLAEVTGLSKGFRGKNPLGHTGDSENYWVFFKDDFAYDHKRDVGYNSMTYLAVEGNARTVTDPHGKFSDREILETWVHAKANGYIKEDDAVPLRGLRAAADQLGICSPEERLESKTIDGREDIEVTDALPDAAYNETVARFESEYGVTPGRSVRFNTEHFLDDELTTENSIDRFARQFLDTEVGEEDTIKPEYGYPRVPVEDVWAAYQAYCEINDVEPQTVYSGGKKQIAKAVGVERGKAYWVEGESESTACYKNVKLTAGGEWLRDRR